MKQYKTAIFFSFCLLLLITCVIVFRIFVGPILLGFLISYLANPLIVHLENRGIKRNTSAIVSVILLILLASTAIWIILPIVMTQIHAIIERLPDFRKSIEQHFLPKFHDILTKLNISHAKALPTSPFPFNYQDISQTFLHRIGESTRYVFFTILFIVSTPIFMFIFMKYWSKMCDAFVELVPLSVRATFLEFFHDIDMHLRSVLRGIVLVVLIMTTLYPIAFLFAGLPTAIAVGVMVGLARVVSGLDTIVALTLGSLVIIINNSSSQVIIASVLVFVTLQAIDMFFINPRVIGKYSGLHPVLILVSVISFGYLFGIAGILLAIPAVTILKVIIQRVIKHYKTTQFFNEYK